MRLKQKNNFLHMFYFNFFGHKSPIIKYKTVYLLDLKRKNSNSRFTKNRFESPRKNEITIFQQYSQSEPSCVERVAIVDYIESFSVFFIKVYVNNSKSRNNNLARSQTFHSIVLVKIMTLQLLAEVS